MTLEDGLRLVQVFLSRTGFSVFYVSYDLEFELLVCDCPGFGARGRCKHVRAVMVATAANGGALQIEVPVGLVEPETWTAEAWRALVLRYSVPLVL